MYINRHQIYLIESKNKFIKFKKSKKKLIDKLKNATSAKLIFN